MPELKNTFTGGKMDKDQDERIVGRGLYREALNIEVATSEDSDVGAAQNILGNVQVTRAIAGPKQDYSSCSLTTWNDEEHARYYGTNQHITHVVDPQADKLYRFINTEPTSEMSHGVWMDRIVEYDTNSNIQGNWAAKEKAVMVDIYKVETTISSTDAPPPPPPLPGDCTGILIASNPATSTAQVFSDVNNVASNTDISYSASVLRWREVTGLPYDHSGVRGYRIYQQPFSATWTHPQWMLDNYTAFFAANGMWGFGPAYPFGPTRTTWADIIADVNYILDDGSGNYVPLNPDAVDSEDIITTINSMNIQWTDPITGDSGFLNNIISYELGNCETLTITPA